MNDSKKSAQEMYEAYEKYEQKERSEARQREAQLGGVLAKNQAAIERLLRGARAIEA